MHIHGKRYMLAFDHCECISTITHDDAIELLGFRGFLRGGYSTINHHTMGYILEWHVCYIGIGIEIVIEIVIEILEILLLLLQTYPGFHRTTEVQIHGATRQSPSLFGKRHMT